MEYWKKIRKKVGHEKIFLNCVAAAIFNGDNHILLQKRKDKELWGFPGGIMELGESFEDTIVRETMEETGLQVAVKRLIGVYSKYSDSYPNGDASQPILIFLECQAVGGTLDSSDDETLELRYFDLNCTPPIFNKQHEDMLNDLKNFNGGCFVR